MISFQEIILRLVNYWQAQGCLVQQPYNVQVGAGTMNPATTLRVLGPEPWHVVYVEPSVRPDDGRFGDNPNRLQMHHQLQVILQPDPGNPQELYLKSLEVIGIDPLQHDIRFVEDNWASPVLGAWGLGWEVWLDGQEITQFTYFQQSGGQTLDPVAVEITYGLDRIALALQGVDSVWKIAYNSDILYEDVLLQSEIEHCEYYFHVADVDAIRTIFDTYENEANRCLEAGLVVPAHDYTLKCSHLFNIMDTRGAIGVTERAHYFHRMRQLARGVATTYVTQRKKLGYPLLVGAAENPVDSSPAPIQFKSFSQPQTFVLEIGTEELPGHDLEAAMSQLQTLVPEMLAQQRLEYGRFEIYGTPRRLAIMVYQLAPRQTDLETVVKGPPADRAFDADGNPTRAAQGFARSKGVDPADLTTVAEGDDRRYAAATVREEGQETIAVLAAELPNLLAAIKFERTMRWNQTNVAFSRPIRWLLALYEADVVPFDYAGIATGRKTRGLRPQGSPWLPVDDARSYPIVMRKNGVVIDGSRRREMIVRVASKLVAEKRGTLPDNEALLSEVANLVERPTPLRGRFDERFLELPEAVLVAVMRKHQRYFPVYGHDGKLLPYFIAVRNGNERHLDIVVDGNEQVLRARFADAAFFYSNDTKKKLADFLPRLQTLTFQTDLGSMLDKVHRLEKLTPRIAQMLTLAEAETAVAARAAALSKADLASSMVIEMTALQGVMGGHYAQISGEPAPVATAISEQYQAVSYTGPGLALALADRLDSLAGLFAVGLTPKGSNDPFALRRAALHLIENLIENETSFDLRAALTAAASLQPVAVQDEVVTAILEFINGRLEGVLRDEGISAPVIKAVLAVQGHNPYQAQTVATMLQAAVEQETWPTLLDAYARCVRITRSETGTLPFTASLLAEEAEHSLFAAYDAATADLDGSVTAVVAAIEQLVAPINRFFDEVLVMVDDDKIRVNRLALLQKIARIPHNVADLSQLEGF